MITFKDKTYCQSDCNNLRCSRNAEEVRAFIRDNSIIDQDVIVSYGDFSRDCTEYIAPVNIAKTQS
jgi:hypothetical protein